MEFGVYFTLLGVELRWYERYAYCTLKSPGGDDNGNNSGCGNTGKAKARSI
jgi:hypothetical protein